jgi:hypothetical protein
MKAQINTNLFPIISVGMYYSPLSPDSIFDDYQINQDKEDGYIFYDAEYFNDNFQNELYKKAIQERADYFLTGTHEANGIEIEIKTGQIYSPSYYNFATDQLELEVKFNKTKIRQFAKDNRKKFDDFLKEHFTSYDGFHSHTANNFEQWLEDFNENNVQSIGAVLTFIFLDEIDDFRQSFYELCNSELFYNEFVDTELIDAEQKLVENYVCQNYQTFNLDSLENLDLEYLDKDSIYKIASLKLTEIDSQTLELELL